MQREDNPWPARAVEEHQVPEALEALPELEKDLEKGRGCRNGDGHGQFRRDTCPGFSSRRWQDGRGGEAGASKPQKALVLQSLAKKLSWPSPLPGELEKDLAARRGGWIPQGRRVYQSPLVQQPSWKEAARTRRKFLTVRTVHRWNDLPAEVVLLQPWKVLRRDGTD